MITKISSDPSEGLFISADTKPFETCLNFAVASDAPPDQDLTIGLHYGGTTKIYSLKEFLAVLGFEVPADGR